MRDYRSGPQYDTRTMRDLAWCRIRVHFWPEELIDKMPPRWCWRLILPRFKCTVCGEKQADATADPLPRN